VGTFDKRIKTYDLRMNNNDEVQHIEDFKFHRLPVLAIATNPNDSNQVRLEMKRCDFQFLFYYIIFDMNSIMKALLRPIELRNNVVLQN
jgi:hypothetical protein